MRFSMLVAILFLGGCYSSDGEPSKAETSEQAESSVSDKVEPTAATQSAISSEPTTRDPQDAAASAGSPAQSPTGGNPQIAGVPNRAPSSVPDLRTRKDGSDWPAFLGPTGDSKSTERGILTEWPAAGPRKIWDRKLGGGYAAPTISRGRLFIFDRELQLTPTGRPVDGEARLTCVKSETGEQLWQFTYETDYQDPYGYSGGPRCCPVVDDDRVYILGPEGILHCLRVVDGELLWKTNTTEKFGVVQNFFGVGSTPVVEGDLLLAQIGGSPPESQHLPSGSLDEVKSNGTGIVAFNKYTGDVKYTLGDELASYSSPKLASIGGRRWCFVFARGGLLGFDPASGKSDFHYPWRSAVLESVNASNPVVVENRVLISETYGPGSAMLEVRPGGYDVVWRDEAKSRDKIMQAHWNTPIHHEGFVYGCSGRHTGNADLRCVDWETGKVVWSEPRLARTSLMYVDGHFLCLGEYGTLRLLRVNPQAYEEVAATVLADEDPGEQFRLLRYPAWAAPVLSHGLLYVRGEDRLVCLELISAKG